jgi:hypothetical protein
MQIKTFNHRYCLFSILFFLFAAQLFGQNTHTTNTSSSTKKVKAQDALTLFLDFKTYNYRKD